MFSYGFPRHWGTLRKLLWLNLLQGAAAVVETVTGTLPLTLANAISKAIVSLTRYGLCTQASTPAGSFVPIKCNNGELRMVDDELPDGYKRVLGLTFNNNAYYEITNFKMRGSDTLRFSFKCTMGTPACNVLGAYDGSSAQSNYSLYVGNASSARYMRYNGGNYRSDVDRDVQYDVVASPTGVTGLKADSTWTKQDFESSGNLCIGTTSTTATSLKMVGDIIGNIIVDGRLKLIPCERLFDNVLGYYDTYSETFFEPAAGFDGAVSLGYDGSHYVRQTVGTPEVLTVSGKNLFDIDTVGIERGAISSSDGTNSNSNYRVRTVGFVPVKPSTQYTLSAVIDGYTSGSERGVFVVEYSGESADDYTGINSGWRGPGGYTFTTGATTTFIRIVFAKSSNVAIAPEDVISVQLEYGDTATEYAPYVAPQTASVPMLLSVGNYKDEVELISGLVDSKIDFVILDGTEDGYGTSSAYGAAVYISSASSKWKANRNGGVLCTHFTQGTASGTQPENTCFFNASGHFYFRTDKTTAQFKTWLAEQYAVGTPVIVMFVRSTPTTESVTPQPLTTAKGTNTVDSVANVSPLTAKVEYMKAA